MVRESYQAHGQTLNFVLVAYEPGYVMTGQSLYLNTLRRVGAIKFPILIEDEMGQSGLGDQFLIGLYDKRQARIVLRYYPTSERSVWPVFWNEIEGYL